MALFVAVGEEVLELACRVTAGLIPRTFGELRSVSVDSADCGRIVDGVVVGGDANYRTCGALLSATLKHHSASRLLAILAMQRNVLFVEVTPPYTAEIPQA